MEADPTGDVTTQYPKGQIVSGKVTEVNPKGATLDLGNGVEGHIRVAEIAKERVDDARTALTVGEEVEAKVLSVDRKTRVVNLSIKAKDAQEDATALQGFSRQADTGATTSLGDLLKEHLGSNKD